MTRGEEAERTLMALQMEEGGPVQPLEARKGKGTDSPTHSPSFWKGTLTC